MEVYIWNLLFSLTINIGPFVAVQGHPDFYQVHELKILDTFKDESACEARLSKVQGNSNAIFRCEKVSVKIEKAQQSDWNPYE